MELYHYTDKFSLPNIKKNGLLGSINDFSTRLINGLLKEYINDSMTFKRDNSVFFFTIPEYEEDEYADLNNIVEIIVNVEDLDKGNLFVANWEYAECIYGLMKIRLEHDVEKELGLNALGYLDSIKQFTSEEDLWLYDSTECFYYGDISPEILVTNILKN